MEETNLRFNLPTDHQSPIKVIGVGGGGSNAVDYMFAQGIAGVDFIVCNTDAQALNKSQVPIKIQLGTTLTKGRGAGAIPEVGKNAAVETLEELDAIFNEDTTMVFITAGMGGGTGTGAAPIIARAARERGILTVGIVTVPFKFEGKKRGIQAQGGLEEMREAVDTLLIIKNEKLRELYGNLSLKKAFSNADEVLLTAAKGIAEVITLTGEINVDMNDVNTVMKSSGVAIMGSGSASGEGRAVKAVQEALESPLLNDNDIDGANYILLNITYGSDEILMDEISEITDYVQDAAGQSAEVIWGYGQDDSLEDNVCVTVIATGFTAHDIDAGIPTPAKEKSIYNLDKDIRNIKAQEIVAPVSKPTETPTVSFESTTSNTEGIDVSPTPIEEPFIVDRSQQETNEIIESNTETSEHINLTHDEINLHKESIEFRVDAPNEVENPTSNNEITEQQLPFRLQEDFISEKKNEITNNLESNDASKGTTDKKIFNLSDDALDPTPLPKLNASTSESKPTNSKINFIDQSKTNSLEGDRPSRQELATKNRNRQDSIRELTTKLKTPSGLKELEDEPAYLRTNINLDDVPHSSKSTTSRLSIDDNENNTLRDNNSFLHDNVD